MNTAIHGLRHILGIVMLLPFLVGIAHARTIVLQEPTTLSQAIDDAAGGDVIQLSGTLPFTLLVKGKSFSPAIVIESLDAVHPSVLDSVLIQESSGIIIRNLDIRPAPENPTDARQIIMIIRSADVALSKLDMVGKGKEYLTPANKSYALAESLMLIRWSKGISIEKSIMTGFCQGIGILESTDIKILENELTAFQGDGIRMGGVQRVDIRDNRIHDFLGSDQSLNHSDMIQLWSTNAKLVSSDITIERNRLLSGNGTATQSIFLRNEQVDHDPTHNLDRFYQRIRISDNLIHNGHLHGITVGETNDLVINNNTLLPNPLSFMGSGENRKTMVPMIRVAQMSTAVKIFSNVTIGIFSQLRDPGRENYLLAKEEGLRDKQLKMLYTGSSFAGSLPDEAYRAQPGGTVSQRKLGSSLTYQ